MTIRLLTLCNTVKWGALPAGILIIRCRVAVSNSYSFKLWLAMTSHVLWRHVIRCHVLRRHVVAVLCSFQHYDDFHILMIWLSCMRSWGIHPRLTIFMFHILISVLTFTVMAVVPKIQTSTLVTPNPKIYPWSTYNPPSMWTFNVHFAEVKWSFIRPRNKNWLIKTWSSQTTWQIMMSHHCWNTVSQEVSSEITG